MRFVIVSALLLSLTGTAAAQPSMVAPRAADREPEVESYRSWVLGTGGVSIGLFLLGVASEGEGGRDTELTGPLFATGMFGHLLTGPLVHLAKGETGRAFGSLALRVAIPMATANIAVAMADCDSDRDWFCELDYIGPGILVGAGIATVIDALWLARREREPRPSGPYVAPYAGPSRGGAAFGLSGAF